MISFAGSCIIRFLLHKLTFPVVEARTIVNFAISTRSLNDPFFPDINSKSRFFPKLGQINFVSSLIHLRKVNILLD